MRTEQVNEMIADITRQLYRNGRLMESEGGVYLQAQSRHLSLFLLYIKSTRIRRAIYKEGSRMVEENDACGWFLGDSVESPSNMTATLLSYASLYAVDIPPHETETYLKERLGGEYG